MKRTFSISLFGLLLTLIVSSCGKDEVVPLPLSSFEVAHPDQRDLVYKYEYPGSLQSVKIVEIITRTEGFIQEKYISAGSKVKAGQLMYLIEPRNYQDKLQETVASVATAKANLAFAETSLERVTEAYTSNAVSELDVIQAQTQVDLARAAINSAEAQVRLAQTNLDYCSITAPCSGRISRSGLDEGNYVKTQTLLTTIYQTDSLYANFSIEVSRLLSATELIKNQPDLENKPVAVLIKSIDSNGKERTYPGEIDYIAPTSELTTGTIDLRAIVSNSAKELGNGLYVKVLLPYRDVDDALVVPDASIGSDQAGRYMYVMQNDTIKYRHVEVGQLEEDNYREVVSGLNKDELYITLAINRVRDGQVINPVMKNAKQSTADVIESKN